MQINSVQSQLPILDSNLKTFKSILAPCLSKISTSQAR